MSDNPNKIHFDGEAFDDPEKIAKEFDKNFIYTMHCHFLRKQL